MDIQAHISRHSLKKVQQLLIVKIVIKIRYFLFAVFPYNLISYHGGQMGRGEGGCSLLLVGAGEYNQGVVAYF